MVTGFGLIPARAGSTVYRGSDRGLAWAHPRSRGEHCARPLAGSLPWGSSPLARGARSFLKSISRCRGLIPARAGSTLGIMDWCRSWWAHPRSRGEHLQ